MVDVRPIEESDIPAFRRLHNRYVDRDESLETVREWYDEQPDLLIGADDDGELVGHALGRPHDEEAVELAGLSVAVSHRRQGVGSELVDAFEEHAADAGFERVTLGSAGGYVDDFYAENGYGPESVLVRLDADEPRPRATFDVIDERVEGDTRKLYVDPEEGDATHLDAVRDAFDDPEAIYVFTKALDGS